MQVIFIRRHLILTVGILTLSFGIALYAVWYMCAASLQEERLHSLASGLFQIMEQRSNDRITDDPEDEVSNWLASLKLHQSLHNQNTSDLYRRSTEYCRPLSQVMAGEEGQVNTSLKLISVHVIIRHGDRSPIYGLPGIKSPKISCQFQNQHFSNDAITQYLNWLKDIEHSPGNAYPDNPFCDGGQLTPQGMLQHIANGQYLGNVYKSSLFNHFDKANSSMGIYIRTSEHTRNLQSALAFTYGLVKNASGLNYSLTSIDVSNVTNFCSQEFAKVPCQCAVLDGDYTQRYLSNEHSLFVKHSTEYSKIKAKFATTLGVPQGNVPWLGVGLDVLMSYLCHHQHLPCVFQTGKCFSHDLVDHMWKVIDQTAASESKTSAKKSYSSLLMYPLLREIAHRLRNITQGMPSPSIALYSGHDKMLIPLTIALGVYDGKWPGFGSRLVMELYRGSLETFYLRVLFNGKDCTSQVKLCKQFVQGLCPLTQFLKSVFSKKFNLTDTYRKACSVRTMT